MLQNCIKTKPEKEKKNQSDIIISELPLANLNVVLFSLSEQMLK